MPSLDFDELKRIKITDLCVRYSIRLHYRVGSKYASAPCPLPMHKPGDKSKTFSVNIEENYWRCFSESCNANNGGAKGGDVINFVAAMERCGMREAAQKLAGWYGIEKTARPKAERSQEQGNKNPSLKAQPDDNPSSGSVKGYLHETRVWLGEVLEVIPDVGDRKRVEKVVMNRIFESWKNGQLGR